MKRKKKTPPPTCLSSTKINTIGVQKKRKHVVKFEASSASLIPPSHMTATPPTGPIFFKKYEISNCRCPHAHFSRPFLNFFQCICLLFLSPDLNSKKKKILL